MLGADFSRKSGRRGARQRLTRLRAFDLAGRDQFGSVWLDTAILRNDRHPTRPLNYFRNTTEAIRASQRYASENPTQRASLSPLRWGFSATEGPFDQYFAEAAPTAALATEGVCQPSWFGDGDDAASTWPLARSISRSLEVGTLTVYGVASSILHTPEDAVAALWESQRLGLFHPRFGFADAFNLNIADAAIPGCVDPADPGVLRIQGAWVNFTGFCDR